MGRVEVALGQEPKQNQLRLPEYEKGVNGQNYSIQRSIEVGLLSAERNFPAGLLSLWLSFCLHTFPSTVCPQVAARAILLKQTLLLHCSLKGPPWPYRTDLPWVWPHVLILFSQLLQPHGFLPAPA